MHSFAEACERAAQHPSHAAAMKGVRLKLVGSCRGKEDERRVELLEGLATQLGVEGKVDFCVNVTHSELQEYVGGALAGLHSMVDEHFGICVVDYMAGGAIPIGEEGVVGMDGGDGRGGSTCLVSHVWKREVSS